MPSKHQNINFTVEHENMGSFSFLDVKIYRKDGKFFTSVYRKPIFSGVFTNFKNSILTYQKSGLLHRLLHRSFSICCDFKTFHLEIKHLKTVFRKNNYPPNVIASFIKSFLDKLYTPVQNVSKIDFFVKLPFLGSTSFQIQRKFKKNLLIN